MLYGVLFISPSPENAKVLSKMLGALSIPVQHADTLGGPGINWATNPTA